uniref:CNH domain-containing protein n=1 Tax=Aureoumbra lagunensis TaxID=44058 RepID=A0A7S3JUX9_9STRA
MRRQVFDELEVIGLTETNAHIETSSMCFFPPPSSGSTSGSQRRGQRFVPQSMYHRLFVGTGEGGLTAYECHGDTGNVSGYEVIVREAMRKPGNARDRKSVTQLEVVPGDPPTVLALVDGVLVCYDAITLRTTSSARDCRGVGFFAVHIPSRTLLLFQKRKARIFAWQRGGGLRDLRRELILPETPQACCLLGDTAAVLVLKKEYLVVSLGGTNNNNIGVKPPLPPGGNSNSIGGPEQIVNKSSFKGSLSSVFGKGQNTVSGIESARSLTEPEPAHGTMRLCEATNGAAVALLIPGSQSAPEYPRLLVSAGGRGLVFDAGETRALTYGAPRPAPLEDRLAWSAPPVLSVAAVAFVVSVLGPKRTRIEIHFAVTLALVQTVDLAKPALCLCGGALKPWARTPDDAINDTVVATSEQSSAGFSAAAAVRKRPQQERKEKYIFTGSSSPQEPLQGAEFLVLGPGTFCRLLRMVDAKTQINHLVQAGHYEDALALAAAAEIHESEPQVEARYAYALYSRGDFEGAVFHWLRSPEIVEASDVVALFPNLCPADLGAKLQQQARGWLSSPTSSGKDTTEFPLPEKLEALRHPPPLRQASLSRAAAALVHFLESTRQRLLLVPTNESRLRSSGNRKLSARELEQLGLIDTTLVSARLQCTPPRVRDVVQLLKSENQHCDLDSVAPLLAAGGPAYAEPLLWLYRSKGLHSRALAMLVEERCCVSTDDSSIATDDTAGPRPWTKIQFRKWKARYVRTLWFSRDPRLAGLALEATATLFDVAPALGLAVFTGSRFGDADSSDDDDSDDRHAIGGAGTPAQDVVAWMKQLELPFETNYANNKSAWHAPSFLKNSKNDDSGISKLLNILGAPPILDSPDALRTALSKTSVLLKPKDTKGKKKYEQLLDDAAADEPLPLDSGNSVAVAYLEFLVSRGEALELLHNELAFLLLDGLLKASEDDPDKARVYRGRLRRFLRCSQRYRADQVLSWLTEDHLAKEKALVLARLGRHDEVLALYIDTLKDDQLAEAYCDSVWRTAREASVARYLRKWQRRSEERNFMQQHSRSSTGEGDDTDDKDLVPSENTYNDDDDDDDDNDNNNDDDQELAQEKAALDVYLVLAKRYVNLDQGIELYDRTVKAPGLDKAISLMSRNIARCDPVKIIEDILPENVLTARIGTFLNHLYNYSEYEMHSAAIEKQLLRVQFVNLKYELTQLQLRQQSKIATVPELARLGRVKRSLPPIDLGAEDPNYHVACTRHVFESGYLVLQFHVTNSAPQGTKLHNVRVKVESLGDADLYAHEAEIPLKVLPNNTTGSCYVVFRTFSTVGTVTTSFAAELRFAVTQEQYGDSHREVTTGGPGSTPGLGPTYLEEIPLQNFELSTADI